MNDQLRALREALECLQKIDTADNPAGRCVNLLVRVATGMLNEAIAIFNDPCHINEYVDWRHKNVLLGQMSALKLYAEGFVPSMLSDTDIDMLIDSLRGARDLCRISDTLVWLPDWVHAAFKMYRNTGGFADLTLKQYILSMRPQKSNASVPKNRRVFGKHKVEYEEIDEEENVKRKVRHKAPRLKNRMGHISR